MRAQPDTDYDFKRDFLEVQSNLNPQINHPDGVYDIAYVAI